MPRRSPCRHRDPLGRLGVALVAATTLVVAASCGDDEVPEQREGEVNPTRSTDESPSLRPSTSAPPTTPLDPSDRSTDGDDLTDTIPGADPGPADPDAQPPPTGP